jgi:hypothetical protein
LATTIKNYGGVKREVSNRYHNILTRNKGKRPDDFAFDALVKKVFADWKMDLNGTTKISKTYQGWYRALVREFGHHGGAKASESKKGKSQKKKDSQPKPPPATN